MPGTKDDGFFHAVRAREYSAAEPEGVGVWKYCFPFPGTSPTEDIRVQVTVPDQAQKWIGTFECARGKHIEVISWREAGSIVVAAANGVYIVNPRTPEKFNGVSAPIEITGVTFDETKEHLFVAESLRIYAFHSDGAFRWMSETLDGYDARLRACGGRVLAVEIHAVDPASEIEESAPTLIRLRTEDGTILRSRFRMAHRYWTRRTAA
jgi:hypothetical protein